jgi:pentatricopeptide repeat protein
MSIQAYGIRVRAEITSQNRPLDLVQVWLIRESKTTGIASYFEDGKFERAEVMFQEMGIDHWLAKTREVSGGL